MSYKTTVLKDDMVHIQADHMRTDYHEIEIESEYEGELESVTIDRSTGKIVIRIKKDDREPEFDNEGDYIKPVGKDRDFTITILEA